MGKLEAQAYSQNTGPSVAAFMLSTDMLGTETQTSDGKVPNLGFNFKGAYCTVGRYQHMQKPLVEDWQL